MPYRALAFAAVLAALVLAACGGDATPEAAPPSGAVPAVPAASSSDGAGVIEGSGEALYAANCARCHGADLNGTGEGPPFLHRVYEPSHHADASFFLAVQRGVRAHHWDFGDMPPVEGLSEAEVAAIIAFVRAQQRAVGIE
ncbi:MAG: hypothetical protein AMXMBFR23_12580 [Chloroflexota bacterium]